jgi:hypothetical protein
MARRKPVPAAELMIQLNRDPEYLARVAEHERRIAALEREYAHEERQISAEAAKIGYRIASVWDFVNSKPHPILPQRFVGPYERAYPLLVRHLRLPHHRRVREGVIRALTVRNGGKLVSDALYAQFVAETDPNLRWVLANALKTAMPLKERKRHPEIERAFKRAL